MGGPQVIPAPHPAPFEAPVLGGSWYLRGDIGIGIQEFRSTTPLDIAIPAETTYGGKHLDDTVTVGAGIGYSFNEWFRADVTAEYRAGQTFGYSYYDVSTAVTPGTFQNNYRGNLSTVVAMLNGYVDLGNFYGITPYVGGGVGAAFHNISGFSDMGVVDTDGPGGPAPLTPVGGAANSNWSSSFAWALTAGASYDVTPGLKLDLNYRYLNMGDATSARINCAGGCSRYRHNDLDSHDLRLGMRWVFAPEAPLPAPLPVQTKF
jgi:opacity protein-like surface antigen